MQPKVAIVYLSYQSRPYLDEVVFAWEKSSYSKEDTQIIIVDNASTDGSVEWIRSQVLPKSGKQLPEIVFFPEEKNHGFAAGNNIGITRALLGGASYVYLQNNDAKLHPHALEQAVALAQTDERIGSVQSLLLLWQKPDTINSTGGMVHFLGFGYARDNGRKRGEGDADGTEIAYASGAAVLYRAAALQRVGLLDPFLFLYHEDLELGWRLRLAGYKNVLSTESIAYHHYEFRRSIKKFFWMERNRFLVHVSHLKGKTLLLLAPFALLTEIALWILSIKKGFARQKLLAYADVLRPRTWRYVAMKRRESSVLRKVTDREIVRLFTSKIQHQETDSDFVRSFANPAMALIWFILRRCILW